jgi:hypothetical protein
MLSHKIWMKMEDEPKYIRDDGGKFVPGIGGGRPKGAKNKVTQERKEKMEYALGLLEPEMEEFFKKLKPIEKARMWLDMHEYLLPKLNRTTVEVDKEDEITEIRFVFKPEGQDEEGCKDQ